MLIKFLKGCTVKTKKGDHWDSRDFEAGDTGDFSREICKKIILEGIPIIPLREEGKPIPFQN